MQRMMSDMKKIVITKDSNKQVVLNAIDNELRKHDQVSVAIGKHERNLSAEQRNLYWMWVNLLAADFGYTKDEMHEELKRQFLYRIFSADEDHHPGFAKLLEIVVRDGDKAAAIALLRMASITQATVKNMSDYLTEVLNHANDNGVVLPLPSMRGLM